MSVCDSCGAEAVAGQRYCGYCGSTLARVCSACGADFTVLGEPGATPLLRAGRARLAAVRSHRAGERVEATAQTPEAIALLRSVDAKPLLAQTLLEQAGRGEGADAVEEARQICGQLRAPRRLERAGSIPGVAA